MLGQRRKRETETGFNFITHMIRPVDKRCWVLVIICCYLPFSSRELKMCAHDRERLQQVNWSICMSFWNSHRSLRDRDTSKLTELKYPCRIDSAQTIQHVDRMNERARAHTDLQTVSVSRTSNQNANEMDLFVLLQSNDTPANGSPHSSS